ncbi:hypothetical protein DFJ58DRAFT_805439 [Suillus subalutaceus]|uniref:uncharacterized protein n=1 Tax=Suillus subalutaceus TaxID=48586 RepID=UPI001B85B8C5|nr:uncharacterized protein DFJ58DRAFT_805439 [Suillus subalutaceus]KAG1842862.1 hypothetical protein DFJ58DRAFT_805439 [Suillus subalutaceus]
MSETLIVEEVMQAALSGTLATMLLYGVTCMQTFHYWQTYTRDKKYLKSMVAFIWLLETAHTALSIHFVEYYLIIHFGEFTHLGYAVWSMGATCFIGFFIGYVVNLCFIWRILQLGQNRWIAVCFVAVATVRCGFGLANCVLSFIYPMWTDFRGRVFATMVTGQVLSAVVDGVIAFTLCFYLRKRRTGMKRTNSIIKRLQLYSINTGAITSLFAVLAVISFIYLPTTTAFVAFVQVQGKLYATSFLASLNARKRTLEKIEQPVPTADALSLFRAARPDLSFLQAIEAEKSITINICGDSLNTGMDSHATGPVVS